MEDCALKQHNLRVTVKIYNCGNLCIAVYKCDQVKGRFSHVPVQQQTRYTLYKRYEAHPYLGKPEIVGSGIKIQRKTLISVTVSSFIVSLIIL